METHRRPKIRYLLDLIFDIRYNGLYIFTGFARMAKVVYERAKIYGSFYILPTKMTDYYYNYDWFDLHLANTILLRINDIAIITVLNDSGAASIFFDEIFKKITGPLSPLQLREVVSHLAYINLNLINRPQYYTKINSTTGQATIDVKMPEVLKLDKFRPDEFGKILYHASSSMIKQMNNIFSNEDSDKIKAGRTTFLFNKHGQFVDDSMEFKP